MNSFETNNFRFFTYDYANLIENLFVNELISDEGVKRYLKSIKANLEKSSDNPLRSSYLVSKDYDIVGYLNLYEEDNVVEIDLAVSPKYRNIKNNSDETIGCQIVKESSNYLFDNYAFIKYIRAMIAKSNTR